ncbi:L-glyceraldehyde 3-phosphate reductase [Alteromonas pelagimontana]|uniref:L-glyceraldehyde 3-phosphate reductase n=1 Tax=Alteromonas pelagimontana TaxID=1858656 RepID=A0A6M4MIH1_9ALTE|nr:L-glyceraldehyde 3-phosphate reductase [Alteromonas pelagimontana]
MNYQASAARYEKMKYKRCGTSGLRLPVVSLGLWQNFGLDTPQRLAEQKLFAAFDAGITHFDLANNYGPPPGSAETAFGRILKNNLRSYRDEIVISTKAGYTMWDGPYGDWGSRKYMLSSLDQSLQRMNLEYVDIFYSHRPDPETPLEETMGALDSAVRSGKALYVGLSNYTADQTRYATDILNELGTPCLIHQPRYSMFDRWTEEDDLHDVLQERGIGCIPFSPLEQGILTSRYLEGIPADSRANSPDSPRLHRADITQEKLAKVKALAEIALERGQTMAQLAMSWLHRQPTVTSVIMGASRVSQIEEAVKIAQAPGFSEDELGQIDAILRR